MIVSNLNEQRCHAVAEARRKHEAGDASGAKQVFAFVDTLELRMQPKPRVDDWPSDNEAKDYRKSAEYRAHDKFYRDGLDRLSNDERRALNADVSTAGGSMVLPMQLSEQIFKRIDDALEIRRLATKVTVSSAESAGAPVVDVDQDDCEWVTELSTGSEDSGARIGKRELHPYPCAKRVRASAKLLKRSKLAGPLVNGRMAYALMRTCEKANLTGNGVSRPLGMFVASDSGIPTSRDVSTGNSSTSIGGDGLIRAMYSLSEGYLRSPSLRWIFHRSAIQQIRLLKDATNEAYLWQPALTVGQPDTLLGVPVIVSEFAPSTFTTGLYVGLIGDMSQYWICDADSVSIQRLNELYIESSLIGFIGRMESDGMPALGEAFARVKLA